MPASIALGNDAFEIYLKLAKLPLTERRLAFSELSNEKKAKFFKVQFALQLVKRPSMTKEQKEFILEAISSISPGLYDLENSESIRKSQETGQRLEMKAMGAFSPNEASEILAALFADKTQDVALLQIYNDLLRNEIFERRNIVKSMPVADRINIWKTQLAYHVATASLSRDQSELILELSTGLSPSTFDLPAAETREESAKRLEALDSRIQSVFSKAESFAIFEELGIQKIVTDTTEHTNSLNVDCNCRWYCSSGTCGGTACGVLARDCGPFGTWFCNYRCG